MITKTKYNPKEIEAKWQQQWEAEYLYHAPDNSPKPKFYHLVMFPYPSGDLHMGHWYNYSPFDAYGRFKRMEAITSCNPSASTLLACLPIMPPSNAAYRHVHGHWRTLTTCASNCVAWAHNGTGSVKLSPASLTTTNVHSGSSCNATSTDWPTAPKHLPTGVRAAILCWQMSRYWPMAPANVVVVLLFAKRSISGCCELPSTLNAC